MVVESKLGRVGASLLCSLGFMLVGTFVFGIVAAIVFALVTGGTGSGMGEIATMLMMFTVPVAAVSSLVLGLIMIPYFYAKLTPAVHTPSPPQVRPV